MAIAPSRIRALNHSCQVRVSTATTSSYTSTAPAASPARPACTISSGGGVDGDRALARPEAAQLARLGGDVRAAALDRRSSAARRGSLAGSAAGTRRLQVGQREHLVPVATHHRIQVSWTRDSKAYGAHGSPAPTARSIALRNHCSDSSNSAQSSKERPSRKRAAQLGVDGVGLLGARDRVDQGRAQALLRAGLLQAAERGDRLGRELVEVEPLGQREGLHADDLRLLVAPHAGEHAGVVGEDPRAQAAVALGRERDCLGGDRRPGPRRCRPRSGHRARAVSIRARQAGGVVGRQPVELLLQERDGALRVAAGASAPRRR